jgi:hypothetical protein
MLCRRALDIQRRVLEVQVLSVTFLEETRGESGVRRDPEGVTHTQTHTHTNTHVRLLIHTSEK